MSLLTMDFESIVSAIPPLRHISFILSEVYHNLFFFQGGGKLFLNENRRRSFSKKAENEKFTSVFISSLQSPASLKKIRFNTTENALFLRHFHAISLFQT